jgi:regulator of sirC expression with transglutaminase-like and TPR domain
MDPAGDDPIEQALRHFASVLRGEPTSVPLDDAALAMSAVLQGGLDAIGWMAALDDLAAACPTPTRDGVMQFLFGERGFAGDRSTYTDWRNSCLDQVLITRRGIPITLSVLAIEVARRVGVPLVGVGMPAHFLVGDPSDRDWFADPFDAGRRLDRHGCRELLETLTHRQVPWRDEHLAPTSNRLIIARMLNNLKAGFAQRNDHVRLALVMRMRLAVPEFQSEIDEAARAQSVLN